MKNNLIINLTILSLFTAVTLSSCDARKFREKNKKSEEAVSDIATDPLPTSENIATQPLPEAAERDKSSEIIEVIATDVISDADGYKFTAVGITMNSILKDLADYDGELGDENLRHFVDTHASDSKILNGVVADALGKAQQRIIVEIEEDKQDEAIDTVKSRLDAWREATIEANGKHLISGIRDIILSERQRRSDVIESAVANKELEIAKLNGEIADLRNPANATQGTLLQQLEQEKNKINSLKKKIKELSGSIANTGKQADSFAKNASYNTKASAKFKREAERYLKLRKSRGF